MKEEKSTDPTGFETPSLETNSLVKVRITTERIIDDDGTPLEGYLAFSNGKKIGEIGRDGRLVGWEYIPHCDPDHPMNAAQWTHDNIFRGHAGCDKGVGSS